ncbi:MAG TPA: hypothetical protein VG694_01640 [Candidatus Paceibacterota bacterium]|jgi:hypothetical protein|nr:hypothetical protein [Candidatus Paceibacterota bacterium]
MNGDMPKSIKKPNYKVLVALYVLIAAWFFYLHLFLNFDLDSTQHSLKIWAATYQVIALLGGIVGLMVSRRWGGHRSVIGKAVMFLSIGLLLQVFGQSFDSYLNVLKNVEIPYPSLGDVGFFGSVIAYIVGTAYMLRAIGFRFSFKSLKGKLIAIVIPLAVLIVSYMFFLKGYEFDWSNPLKVFLDFGYPFGQAIYVSLAILAFLVSRNYLGGMMKRPMLFLILSLFVQYACDFTFLYQANAGNWYAGGINDFMYFTSYLVMSVSLIRIGRAYYKIKES